MIFGEVGDILGKARKMQENFKQVQQDLADTLIEENSGGVKIVVSADMELREFKLEPKVLENDLPRIEWLISDAVDKAYSKAKKEAMDKFKKVAGGLAIPGLF